MLRSSENWSLRSTPATIELSDSRFRSHGIRKQKIIATRPSHPLGTQPDPLVEQNSVDSTHTMTNQMLRSFSASNSEGRRRTTIKTQEDFQKWFHAQFPDDKISSSNEEQNQPGAVWLRNHRLASAKAIRKTRHLHREASPGNIEAPPLDTAGVSQIDTIRRAAGSVRCPRRKQRWDELEWFNHKWQRKKARQRSNKTKQQVQHKASEQIAVVRFAN